MDHRTPKPPPGTRVHLVMLDRQPALSGKPTWVLDGIVVKSPDWETDSRTVALFVQGSEVPDRTILMSDVVSINGQLVRGWDQSSGSAARTWTVRGSKDNVYLVKLEEQQWSCQCRGFAFYRHCKHIDVVVTGLRQVEQG